MKYFALKPKLTREQKKELSGKLTALDRTILRKAGNGEDIVGLISSAKPYVNEFGTKEFATTDEVLASVKKLIKLGLLGKK